MPSLSSNNGLVQDSCMLVLVYVIDTLGELQAFSKVSSSYGPLAYLSDIFIPSKNVVFSAHFSNNGLVQDSVLYVGAGKCHRCTHRVSGLFQE